MESEIFATESAGKWFWDDLKKNLVYYDPLNQTSATFLKKREKDHHYDSVTEIKNIKNTTGTHRNEFIRLLDVKSVTLSRITESVDICKEFESFLNSKYIDIFLVRLLIYFNCYLLKKKLKNENTEMIIEKSAIEKEEYEKVCKEVRNAKRLLGYSYSTILLGMNSCKNHHMKCGKVHISDTYTDRMLFEALIRFSAVFVWISLGRKNIDDIKEEINTLLGNKSNENIDKNEKTEEPQKFELMERSLVSLSIIPTAKDKSQGLFKKPTKYAREMLECQPHVDDLREYFENIENFDPYSVKVGIIGERSILFNPLNLAPIEDEASTKKVTSAEIKSNLSKYYDRRHVYEMRHEQINQLKIKQDDEK